MIYARILLNWVEKFSEADFAGSNATFATKELFDDYLAAHTKWKPETIYARIVNNWPVEIRDVHWPQCNLEFSSVGDYEKYCEDNAVSRPASADVPRSAEEIWADKLAGGWTDPVSGIKLKTNEAARNLFIGQFVLIQAGIMGGKIQPTDNRSIWDADEVEHKLSAYEILELLGRYGAAWEGMFNKFAP